MCHVPRRCEKNEKWGARDRNESMVQTVNFGSFLLRNYWINKKIIHRLDSASLPKIGSSWFVLGWENETARSTAAFKEEHGRTPSTTRSGRSTRLGSYLAGLGDGFPDWKVEKMLVSSEGHGVILSFIVTWEGYRQSQMVVLHIVWVVPLPSNSHFERDFETCLGNGDNPKYRPMGGQHWSSANVNLNLTLVSRSRNQILDFTGIKMNQAELYIDVTPHVTPKSSFLWDLWARFFD